ncbi:hypothetical protein A2G06_16790 (plasmid) [Geobacter anodireducens]|nr:hypothetical protein A2G06_16790 [Geobacter anodireducens]
MHNPFYLKALDLKAPFCNRVGELEKLTRMAESRNDVVIYAPRRFGKTSLVRRVQKGLADNGAVTIFVDFNVVAAVNDVAVQLAEAVYKVTHGNEPLWKKAIRALVSFRPVMRPSIDGTGVEITAEVGAGKTGMELLESIMKELHQFVSESDKLVHIVFDEFQEIVTLPEAAKIEAVMRTWIQKYRASHFFVGSRRRILQGMFNDEQRPFFRSAFNFHLSPLPQAELADFIVDLFAKGGKKCPLDCSQYLVRLVDGHPHYAMKWGFHIFELSNGVISMDDTYDGLGAMLSDDQVYFSSLIQSIPPQQRLLLRALAKEPMDKVMSKDYVRKHNLGSSSAITHSLKQLEILDYIEQGDDKYWRVVDPMFKFWMAIGEKSSFTVVSETFEGQSHNVSHAVYDGKQAAKGPNGPKAT